MLKQVQHQLNKIEQLVTTINQKDTEFMDINEVSKFLKLKKSTIYQFRFYKKQLLSAFIKWDLPFKD